MAIYMKLGDKIKGNVTAEGFKDQIELHSLQWGVGRGISTPVGSSANREASAPSISEVTVSKELDNASAQLFTEATTGKADQGLKCEITIVKTGDKLEEIAKFTLENTMISGYSLSSGGDRPSESLSLNFTKVEYKVTPTQPDGKAGDPVTSSFNLATGKA
ncbi:MAG: type VI secretion system tube protein Hcp [Alphaproteobacteria bacterium]